MPTPQYPYIASLYTTKAIDLVPIIRVINESGYPLIIKYDGVTITICKGSE